MTKLEQSALKARNTLLTMFLGLCTLDTTLVMIAKDRWAIGRILLTIVVMYFVMQGHKWAKWFLMGICSFVVIILVAMVITLRAKLSTIIIVGSLIMAILSAIIPIYMASSKDLNHYFSSKRQAYSR
jgi:ABC-type lipoprotein release transport system permease subunit